MTERSYQDAVQLLKDRMGGRWEGLEADGRDEMVSILKERLGYDNREANDAIDAMIESGTLRYHRTADPGLVDRGDDVERRDADPVDEVVPPIVPAVAGTAGAGTGATGGTAAGGLAAVPIATGALSGGYWQIGTTVSEVTDVVGRAGQVEPR